MNLINFNFINKSLKNAAGLKKNREIFDQQGIRENYLFSKDFILILINQLSFGLSSFTFLLLPKYMTMQLNATASEIGEVSGVFGISIVIGMFLAGIWIDKYGRIPFIILGAAINVLSSFGFIFVDEVNILLFILRILQGLAFAFVVTSAATIVSDLSPPEHLGRALGIWGASLMITNGISPYILEIVSDKYGWDHIFVISAAIGFPAVMISFFIKEKTVMIDKSVKQSFPFRKLLPVLFSVTAAGIVFSVLFTYYQPFALEIGISRVSGFLVGFTVSVVFTRIFLSGIADRVGRLLIAVLSLLIYSGAAISMAWLQPGLLEIIGAIFGLAHGLFFPSLNAYAVEIVSEKIRGRVISSYNGSFNIGYTLGAVLFGPVIEWKGYPVVFIASGFFVFTAVAALIIMKKK